MKIFAGPPGTGKTYEAAREAVRVLIPNVDDDNIIKEHRRLVDEGRIIWVTFHPSFTYEDFVEGFRPKETESGAITYSIIPGPFLLACQTASSSVSPNRFHIGQKLGPRENYEVTHIESGGIVLRSKNNKKNRVTDEAWSFVDFYTLKVLEETGVLPSDLRAPGTKSDDADATDEVNNDVDQEKKGYDKRREIAIKTNLRPAFFADSGPYAAAYEFILANATRATDNPVVLVIDEINRADLSRVFGELITLLEFDKRQGATEERKIRLTYSQKPLTVPSNLSIIGTMNTADRSLSTVDIALRRRFEFILVTPEPSLTPDSYGGLNIRLFFQSINRRLAYIAGGDNLVGHADYMKSKLDELRIREGFADDENGRLQAFAQTLRTKTVPFLIDIFRSDWIRVRAVVGKELFEPLELPDDIPEELADAIGTEANELWRTATWWDPKGKWDGSKLLNALTKYRTAPSLADTEPT